MTMLSQQKIKDGSYVIEKERKRDEKINAGYEKIICMVYWLAKEEITMNNFHLCWISSNQLGVKI